MSVSATIVVHFGDDVEAGAFAVAMLDDELNVDGQGEPLTSFAPGSEIYFLVQHEPALVITRIAATDGQVVAQPQKYYAVTDRLDFAEDYDAAADSSGGEQQLSMIPAGAITPTPYGRVATAIRYAGRLVRVLGGTPVKYDFAYRARVRSWKLLAPNVALAEGEEWPITIHIYMEAV